MLIACFHYSDCNVVVLVTDKLTGNVSVDSVECVKKGEHSS